MTTPSDLSSADTSFLPAPENAPTRAIPPVHRIGHFLVEAELGRGGMGVVYRARDEKLRRTVAIKVLVADGASPEFLQRFLREARSAAKLRHAGIVQVYDVGEDAGRHFFSMEYVAGASLDRVLRDPAAHGLPPGPVALDPRAAAELLRQVADAVEHAHQQGVIHRDLKPANIIIERGTCAAKVADFGLAKDVTLTPEEARTWARLTRPGMMFGTPSYMSPEQASGRPESIGRHSDTYSLGAVLYETLAGRPPLEWKSTDELLREVGVRRPAPLRTIRADVPRDLETICLKALEKSPGDRYATAGALERDLALFLAGEPILARPVGAWTRAGRRMLRHPGLLAAAGIALLVALGVGLYTRHLARDRDLAREAALLAQRERVERAVERAGGTVPGGDAATIREALEGGFVAVTDPALRELTETLRRTAAERLEALHARVVKGLEREIGGFASVEADVGGVRRTWEGKLVAVDRARLVLLPSTGAAVTVAWSGVVPAAYAALVSRLVVPAGAQDRFDLALHAYFQGARDRAAQLLEQARAEAGPADARLRADTGVLLEHLGVETDEALQARERRSHEASLRREAEAQRVRDEQARAEKRRADLLAAEGLLAQWRPAEALARLHEAEESVRAPVARLAAAWDALTGRLRGAAGSALALTTVKGLQLSGTLLEFAAERSELVLEPAGAKGGRVTVRLADLPDEIAVGRMLDAGTAEADAEMTWTLYLASAGGRPRALERLYAIAPEHRLPFGRWAAVLGLMEPRGEAWAVPGEEEWRVREAEAKLRREAEAAERAAREAAERARGGASVRHADLRFVRKNQQGREEYEHLPSGIVLVLLPVGTFTAGSPEGEVARKDDERPATAKIPRAFLIGKTEVTNAQYKKLFPAHSSSSVKGESLDGDDQPVVEVTWAEAQEFCERSSLRLPTEVEWEYAARAGTKSAFPWGTDWPPGRGAGNFWDLSSRETSPGRPAAEGMETYDDGYAATAPVGRFRANGWGLHDLGGNVAEWCADDRDDAGAIGPGLARQKAVRGASWESDSRRWLRCAARGRATADKRSPSIGFRVVMDLEGR